ncbi:Nicotinamidase-related amidase [Aliiroseovarius crassostreae]|uniref:Isochorismatase-like domain-containing protein n=1 Tax=Aliiroseovarius crassostreae TaxID=154981 RepID=A0A0P7IIL6_9RHOB|nr:cysteine hydrolase [Aliiroseovarius crassostreae]KPN63653.1 hypothetical protein AKJ29_13585 [Aliiroseovarius crassostreae]SFU73475.1 Nicotinamidase-related amidase [Aliiroseovarius crassostreae]
MIALWTSLALLAAGVIWAALVYRHISHVSQGDKIPERSGTALLLVDLQEDFWNSGQYDEADKTQATQAIRAAVTRAKSEDQPVITLRQEWSTPSTRTFARIFMKGQGLAGQPGAELASSFVDMGEYEVIKRVQDGFETGALDTLLDQLDIGHVQIAGLDAALCVNKTAQAALARGYKVTLLQDGTLGALPKATEKAFETLKDAGAEVI